MAETEAEAPWVPCSPFSWLRDTPHVIAWDLKLSGMMWVPATNPQFHFLFHSRLTRIEGTVVPEWVHRQAIQDLTNFNYILNLPRRPAWTSRWTYIEHVERLMEPAVLRRLLRVRRMLDIID
jgi:hypothetical protein